MRCRIKLHQAVAILGILQIISGCREIIRKDTKSDSKNIEVAAQGTNEAVDGGVDQSRKIEYCLAEKGTDTAAVSKAIIKKLPARLAKEYESVQVTLISDVEKIHTKCLEVNGKTTAMKASAVEKYIACWGPTSKTNIVDVRPEIFLLDDVDTIHSNLIVMVISSYLELYIDQIMTQAAESLKADDPNKLAFDAFKGIRKELALQFAKFLSASPEKDVAGTYKEKFLGDAKASDEKLYSDVGFQNFALAEIGESAFCSNKTLSVLKEEKYKDILKAFEPFNSFFNTVQ